jgi:hypothetical protein
MKTYLKEIIATSIQKNFNAMKIDTEFVLEMIDYCNMVIDNVGPIKSSRNITVRFHPVGFRFSHSFNYFTDDSIIEVAIDAVDGKFSICRVMKKDEEVQIKTRFNFPPIRFV